MRPHEVKPRTPSRADEFKRRKQPHNWQPTTRRVPGGITLYFHACNQCTPAHMQAYDLSKNITKD